MPRIKRVLNPNFSLCLYRVMNRIAMAFIDLPSSLAATSVAGAKEKCNAKCYAMLSVFYYLFSWSPYTFEQCTSSTLPSVNVLRIIRAQRCCACGTPTDASKMTSAHTRAAKWLYTEKVTKIFQQSKVSLARDTMTYLLSYSYFQYNA